MTTARAGELAAALRGFRRVHRLAYECAEAVVAAVWPELAEPERAKVRRLLAQPELFTYLDRLHEHLDALPAEPALKQAVLRAEILRRQPERTKGETVSAAAARGILLVTAALVTLNQEAVPKIVHGVRWIS